MDNAPTKPPSELRLRIISAVIMAVVALGTAWFGSWPFALVWAALAAAVGYEWGRVVHAPAAAIPAVLSLLPPALAAHFLFFPGASLTVPVAIAGVVMLAGLALLARRHGGDASMGWLGAGIIYAGLLGAATILVRGKDAQGITAIFFLFAVVWMTDIGAYFAGRTFGGPKFAPRISPKKTWSGVAGGVLSGVLCGLGVLAIAGISLRTPHVALSLCLAISVVYGDLFESFLKRRFGVKDAGSLIPGHGGFLDRLDGFTIAVILAALIGALRGGLSNVAGGLLGW